MTPNDVSDAVVASLRAKLGTSVRSIEPHTGLFDDAELARYGANVPAVRVALVGLGGFSRASSGEAIVPLRFVAVCLAKDTAVAGAAKVDRRVAVQALATAVALAIDFNQFGLSGVAVPDELQARNQYSARGDELGLSIWQVMWTSRVVLGHPADDALPALAKLYVNAIQFSGPGAEEGVDPIEDIQARGPQGS